MSAPTYLVAHSQRGVKLPFALRARAENTVASESGRFNTGFRLPVENCSGSCAKKPEDRGDLSGPGFHRIRCVTQNSPTAFGLGNQTLF
jgi:hypothetical protein